MNKKEFVDRIAEESGLTKKDAESALNATLTTIGETLKKGEKLTLVGFGAFSTSRRAARTGRNPQTGIEIEIPEKIIAKFKAGKALEENINS